MKRICAVIPVVLVFGGVVFAQSAPATAPAKPATTPVPVKPMVDLCRGPIDPYDSAKQKREFYATAGVDGELDHKEFDADKARPGGFVRAFDTWKQIAAFDNDNNKTLDWLEADAYRRALRKRVLTTFDTNKDRRLKGAERAAANRALAAGKISLAQKTSPGAGVSDRLRAFNTDAIGNNDQEQTARRQAQQARRDLRRFDADRDGELNEAEMARRDKSVARAAKRREDFLKRYDTDGDGKVDGKERAAMRESWRARAEVRRFDADKDGELNEAETANRDKSRAEAAERRAEAAKRRADFLEKHDTDGDGKLSRQERSQASRAMREQRQQQALKEFDADGDGELNESERRTARDARRRRMRDRLQARRTRAGKATHRQRSEHRLVLCQS